MSIKKVFSCDYCVLFAKRKIRICKYLNKMGDFWQAKFLWALLGVRDLGEKKMKFCPLSVGC